MARLAVFSGVSALGWALILSLGFAGVATAAEVPRSDTYSLDYIAHIIPVNARLLRNNFILPSLHEHSGASD